MWSIHSKHCKKYVYQPFKVSSGRREGWEWGWDRVGIYDRFEDLCLGRLRRNGQRSSAIFPMNTWNWSVNLSDFENLSVINSSIQQWDELFRVNSSSIHQISYPIDSFRHHYQSVPIEISQKSSIQSNNCINIISIVPHKQRKPIQWKNIYWIFSRPVEDSWNIRWGSSWKKLILFFPVLLRIYSGEWKLTYYL